MFLSTARALVSENPNLDIYENYVGGVPSSVAFGVIGTFSMFMKAVSGIMEEALYEEGYDNLPEDEYERWSNLMLDLAQIQQDSLGTRTIFY